MNWSWMHEHYSILLLVCLLQMKTISSHSSSIYASLLVKSMVENIVQATTSTCFIRKKNTTGWMGVYARKGASKQSRKRIQSTYKKNHGKVPIVILPGFLTPSSSPMYAAMATHLSTYIQEASRGTLQAVVRMPYMGYGDWFKIVGGGDFSTYLDRAYNVVEELYKECDGEDVRILGHSAGGWVARLLLGDVPYQGRVYNAKSMVNTLFTLGTPHLSVEQYPFGRIDECIDVSHIHASGDVLQRIKTSSLQYCNYVYPRGDAFEPDTKIVCVAGDGEITSFMTYQSYKSGCGKGSVRGDGVTPLEIAILPHASKSIVLQNVSHFEYGEYANIQQWFDLCIHDS